MHSKPKIAVIIEDDRHIADSLSAILSKYKVSNYVFYDSNEFFNWVENENISFDIIISDFSLDNSADGSQLINYTLEKNPKIVSILISGYIEESIDQINTLPSTTYILEKPFTFSKIIDILEDENLIN